MSGRPISDIVGSYDIDEGSLIRTMLKMGNVVEGVGLRVYADVFQFELSFLFPHGNQLTVLRRVAQPRDSLWPSQHAAILAAC